MMTQPITVFWFRRDLRLNDNHGLYKALSENISVLPVFIFDQNILDHLDNSDHRVTFIFDQIQKIKTQLQNLGSDLLVQHSTPTSFFKKLSGLHKIKAIYTNHDYEIYGQERDLQIRDFCVHHHIEFYSFKDHVIFEKKEILTDQKNPYTVFTPYKKKWLSKLTDQLLEPYPSHQHDHHFFKYTASEMPGLKDMGFTRSQILAPELKLSKTTLKNYAQLRDYPFEETGTSKLGVHLRFGTASIRYLVKIAKANSEVWLSELIWRDFFNQILFHYPSTENKSFRPEYEDIAWRNHEDEFKKWTEGLTGYPLVDAGMRELKSTGHMHNRVRMVTASFLTKHLLHHWKKGERYFAQHLFDYDLSANVGNWQWAAGTGCDAAPYFRIFNPLSQQEKFDPHFVYIKKWIPEYGTAEYPTPMVDHVFARERCLAEYKKGLRKL
jgi:deoxyribodipyrimidine photo-lyase